MAHAAATGGAITVRLPTADGLPVGRLVAIRHGGSGAEVSGVLHLEAGGGLRETLTVDGQPLVELPPGTRLRVGDTVVVEVTVSIEAVAERGEARGGVMDALTGVSVPARIVAGGAIGVGDPVLIEAVPIPLEDVLDLHPFRPEEIPAVVGEYLHQARAAGFGEVRIIHGRGRGVQRETVRRLLAASPVVATFVDAPPEGGGWGATIAQLRTTREEPPA